MLQIHAHVYIHIRVVLYIIPISNNFVTRFEDNSIPQEDEVQVFDRYRVHTFGLRSDHTICFRAKPRGPRYLLVPHWDTLRAPWRIFHFQLAMKFSTSSLPATE